MDIHFDDLATFVFQRNPMGRKFIMSIEGIQTTKELFFFLLDLVCKGLVLLYGSDGNSVDLSTIDDVMFKKIAERLACAGISVVVNRVDIDLTDYDTGVEAKTQAEINMPELMRMPDQLDLEHYILKMRMPPTEIRLSFCFCSSQHTYGPLSRGCGGGGGS